MCLSDAELKSLHFHALLFNLKDADKIKMTYCQMRT